MVSSCQSLVVVGSGVVSQNRSEGVAVRMTGVPPTLLAMSAWQKSVQLWRRRSKDSGVASALHRKDVTVAARAVLPLLRCSKGSTLVEHPIGAPTRLHCVENVLDVLGRSTLWQMSENRSTICERF